MVYNSSNNRSTPPNPDGSGLLNGDSYNDANWLSRTVIDSTLHTSETIAQDQSAFVDLGDSQVFDRIMVRWNTNTASNDQMGGVPSTVNIEASSDGETWAPVVVDFDNSKARATMTNFVFEAPLNARYLKITPRGVTTASSTYGHALLGWNAELSIFQWRNSTGVTEAMAGGRTNDNINARAAQTNFRISAVEVYQTYNYVEFEIAKGSGIKVIEGDDLTITEDSSVYESLVEVVNDGNIRNLTVVALQDVIEAPVHTYIIRPGVRESVVKYDGATNDGGTTFPFRLNTEIEGIMVSG
jgi:hypothetical protein